MGTTVLPLPLYPSHGSLSSLSPSQHSSLTQQISNALQHTLALPPAKRDTPAARAFVDSYAREGARETLEATIWDSPNPKSRSKNKADAAIRNRVLLLAEKLASSQAGLEIETLIDLCVVYSTSHPNRLRAVLASAFKTSPTLLSPSLPDAFASLLQPSSPSLYALRKTSFCLLSLLRAGPDVLATLFARDKQFMLALGRAYDTGLTGIARSYGGLRSHEHTIAGEGDDWEKVWTETKVALMDSFHILLSAMISGLVTHGEGAPGLGSAVEGVFDVVFALLDLPSSSTASDDTATPFLNRSLLADYQHAYNMTHTLAQALSRQAEQDARIEVLESSLASASSPGGPGALKIILRSSGAPPGVDMRGPNRPNHKPVSKDKDKGKGKAPDVPQAEDLEQDTKTAQVLSILPEADLRTVRALLRRDGANVENVLELLFEGAGMPDDLQLSDDGHVPVTGDDAGQGTNDYVFTQKRRNVFDDEVIDVSSARVGKKAQDEETILRDRTFIEEMKADILRRAELISDSEDEEAEEGVNVVEKQKGRIAAYEDELEEAPGRVHGDGEDSAGDEDSGDDEEGGVQEETQTPETMLELAYIQDPSVFERDAATRRGKARQALCDATHMSNEQIEGWRIMLEKDPKKDKRLQKHEFAGNHNQFPPASVPSNSPHNASRGRGGGRGGGGGARGGRGRGGGAAGGSGGADGGSTRERAWKDKNKASRGNHNRKRGHDKKMARGGAGFPPV